MSLNVSGVFKSVESDAVHLATFVVKEMTAAEELLGAKTGSTKANIVITAVEAALAGFGVPVGTAEAELKTVADAITAFFTKVGIFIPTPPTA